MKTGRHAGESITNGCQSIRPFSTPTLCRCRHYNLTRTGFDNLTSTVAYVGCMTAPHHLGRYLDDVDRSHWPDLASVVMFLRYRDSCLSVSAYGVTGQRWCTSHGTPKKVVIPPAHELPLLTSLHDAGASMKCLGWELRFLLVSCSPRLTAPASSLAHNNRTSRSRSSGGREQTRRAGRLWP